MLRCCKGLASTILCVVRTQIHGNVLELLLVSPVAVVERGRGEKDGWRCLVATMHHLVHLVEPRVLL
jgi:hypothetical protein